MAGRIREKLFAARARAGFGWLEAAVLAVYCGMVAWTIPNHEAWADEAQAWLIASNASAGEIFHHLLHYEGTPGLWHGLLLVLVKMHVTYAGMHWVCGGIAAVGVAVWLRWSPLPLALRVLMPFTFFVAYQFAVVARSYVLFPVLVFGLCAAMRSGRPRPVVVAVLAALMAHVSLHGAVFSFGMVWVYGVWAWRRVVG